MALTSQNITKVCKYWCTNEPEVCSYWDDKNKKCINNSEELRPTYFPDCNLIGTSHQCNLYTGTKIKARCILPDPLRGGTNKKTGKKWITRDPDNRKIFIGFDDITSYGDDGLCNADPESKGDGYGVGNGLSSLCAGYNPNQLEFGNYFNDLPLDLQILNLCARLGRCVWWASEASTFELNDNGGVIYPQSMCVHTDDKTDEFKTLKYNEELGIFILPCNGASSSCPFYTGIKWVYCVTTKLYPGCEVLAEQIQEIRYYFKKNSWTDEYFSDTFYNPDIYAWDKSKGYQVEKINSEVTNSTNIYFSSYNQIPSVISVIEVKIPKFSSFNLEFRNIELTKGTKEKEINVDYPTLIEQLPSLIALPPLILNVFDTEEGDDGVADEDVEDGADAQVNEQKTNIFELVDVYDSTILIFGETKYYNSQPYAINLTLEDTTGFPVELHIYESLFDIKKNISSKSYDDVYNRIDNRLTYYINYNQKSLGIDNTPQNDYNIVSGEFFINIETVIGDNTIVVFDKGSGSWEYSKINVKKNYHGVVIAQTEFHVESTGKNIEYPPYYPASFCGAENPTNPDNKRITFDLKTFGTGGTEISHVYNDYVIENDNNEKKYEAGYIPYEVITHENITLDYDNGDIVTIGNGGYLLLIVPDPDRLLHSIYRSWTIDDAKTDEEIVLTLEYTPQQQKVDNVGNVVAGQKSINVLESEATNKSFELEVFMRADNYLPNNQLIVRPKDITKISSIGPGCFITISKIVIYEKKSFGDESEGNETDYIKQSVEIDGEDEIISKNDVLCKNETQFELINKTRGKLTSITDETLFIAVVFKSTITGRILGITRTKMIVWVRHPSCRAVPIFYKWGTEYEEYDLVPLQYYRFDDIGILKRPAKDSYINVKYTPGYGEFIMHPFIFAPTKALYIMDDDVIEFLQLDPEDFVIEYYRTVILSGLETVYDNEDTNAIWEYAKTTKVGDPELITYSAKDIEHGYYDMCKLCNPKNNVTIWFKQPFGGFLTFCLTNYGPANLVSMHPPDFIGAALYYAGLSVSYYEYCMYGWSPGIVNPGSSLFTMEYNYGKFGGGSREVMDSYRSVDNVCYDTGSIEFEEYFKDMIAFEKLKTGGSVSKLKADLISAKIKTDSPEYFFRRWMPMYNTFSASDLNSNLINYPFNEYTFDLKSPYYHPFSIYTTSNIDGIDINETIIAGDIDPPENYNAEEDGEYVQPPFKKFKFDSIFDCNSFESTFLGEVNNDGVYEEFDGANGILYPNRSGQDIDYPNNYWLVFKENPTTEEGEENIQSVQWVWREREAVIDRYINSEDVQDTINTSIENTNLEEQSGSFNFNKITANAPYIIVDNNDEDVTGIFKWLPIKHPIYFFDYKLKEWNLTSEDTNAIINVLFIEDEENTPRSGIFFIQLNDGPPRGINKDGVFDPEVMLDMESINGFNIPELYELYTTCTNDPWSSKVTLFDTGYESIDKQDAIDDDRYYYLEKPYIPDGEETDNKHLFHRGLDISSDVSPLYMSNFNGEYLPNIKKLVQSHNYEIKASAIPDINATNSAYTSIEPNIWFPNNGHNYNIVYKNDDNYPYINISFRFFDVMDISKIVCKFKCGKKRVSESVQWTDKTIITDNLFNDPGIQIKINGSTIYTADNINFYVEGQKDLDGKEKQLYPGGEEENSVIGKVNYLDNSDNIVDVTKVYEWPVNLLEDAKRSDIITISFRIEPSFTELKNSYLIDTNYIHENNKEIIYTKQCLHLDSIYIYNSTLVNAYEKIKVNSRGYFVSTGNYGDFQPNKFDVSNIERAFLKTGYGKERIPTLTQVDNFDGIIFYPDSDKECISIDKCRGRLMGDVQSKEKESFVNEGSVEGASNSGKTKKTLDVCEKKQNDLYQEAIDKGDTEFIMKSMCPPGLSEVLNNLGIDFPVWECKFTNKMVLPLCKVLDVDPIEPEGYYFDWGLDNILKRHCFTTKYGHLDSAAIDCFDGYKLKSSYDDDKIIGVSMDEIWATSPGANMLNRSSVQSRQPSLYQTGWTEAREKDDDENKEFFDTLISLQSSHAVAQESMRNSNESVISNLNSTNITALNNLFIEYASKIDAEEDAAKVDMEIEYVTKKYDLVIIQQTIIADTNMNQISIWSELIVTQYKEIESKDLSFVTPVGGVFRLTDQISFQKKVTFDTNQTIEDLKLEKTYDLKKIENEKELNIKITETKKRTDYTTEETSDEVTERLEKQEELETEYENKLQEIEDEYKSEKKALEDKQINEQETYYKENNIHVLSNKDTDTVRYVTNAMYGYGTQAEDKEFMFADITTMTDVIVDLKPAAYDIEEYGSGELFEVQREAYYNLLKENELTTDIFPAPIMAYYIKKKEEEI